MSNSVEHVFVVDAVLAGCKLDVHLDSLRDQRFSRHLVHRPFQSRRTDGGGCGGGQCGSRSDPCDASESEVPEGVVDEVSTTRVARAKALEEWANNVDAGDLVVADTDSLRAIAELAEHRSDLDAALLEAIRSARRADRSWSEIGAMLGVSKQAAQRKYAKVAV